MLYQREIETRRLCVSLNTRGEVSLIVRQAKLDASCEVRGRAGQGLVIEDAGARAETFAACHLLKAVEGWTDLGFGSFELRYLRDKLKREVDFLIVRDRKPWCLVEVKSGDAPLSPALAHFQSQTKARHAFQLNFARPFEAVDCFQHTSPVIVPARAFLSQLL